MSRNKPPLAELERAFAADRSNDSALLHYLTALTRSFDNEPGVCIEKAVMKVLKSYPVGHQTHLVEILTDLLQSPEPLLTDDDKKRLSDEMTNAHRGKAAKAVGRWLAGDCVLEYNPSTQLSEKQRAEIKRLWELTTIQSYSYEEETNSDLKNTACNISIDNWTCQVSYETSYYLERDEIRIYGPNELALMAEYDNSCKPENWLSALKSLNTTLPPSLLLCFIYQIAFNHRDHIAPYEFFFETLLEELDELQPALDKREEHRRAIGDAVDEWRSGAFTKVWSKTCPALNSNDKKEVKRLLKNTTVERFLFDNPKSKLVDSKCAFTIGKWRGLATWKSRFSPRVRDRQLSHINKTGATAFMAEDQLDDWMNAAKAAKSKLSLEQFIYFVHIVAFDLIHNDVKSHRPQWPTDFKETLKALEAN